MRKSKLKQKHHTGCSCSACRKGKTKKVRRTFHKLMRRFYKKQLTKEGEITETNKSIGYTD
jgi:hypothetical protein